MASKSKLEGLNVTSDEIKRIGDALKDENFRKLFLEYAQEISDPENRRRYEEEITQMENDRGMDVQFINPQPGHVLETSIDGKTKAFINICQNDKIEKPSSQRKTDRTGKTGVMWHIPHSFAPPREDVEKGEKCQVYDVVFHPDTYRMAETNDRFLKLVHDTAVDGIEKQFDVKCDRKNLKKLSINFKGITQATVIRKKNKDGPANENSEVADILKNMPYPYDTQTTLEKMQAKEAERKKKEDEKQKKNSKTKKLSNKRDTPDATVPEYTIIHRSDLDLQEYRNAPDAHTSTRPKELVIKIFLPLLPSAGHASLDIFQQRLKLESKEPAAYTLDIKLPYPVNDEEGSAKFDKAKRCLHVTVPVLPAQVPKLPSFIEDEIRINGDSHDMTDNSENEITDSNAEPKVVELASQENEIEDYPTTEDMESKISVVEPQVAYTLPEFTYSQDVETLSFVFNVCNISENSIRRSFAGNSSLKFTFTSLGSGGFPMHYCMMLKFDDGCKIAIDHCTTDLSEMNLVLVLLKEKMCRGSWEKFSAGLDEDHLQEKLLLADISLQKQLDDLDVEAEDQADLASGNQSYFARMKDKKLRINIQTNTTLNDEADDEYDPPSSADIEVVHKKAPPQLHSILKQRTTSESSDDHTCSGGESPRSQDDTSSPDTNPKKSVTFNQHIDSATYKKNAAPTSMKATLKSKRRRARKKEEKKTNGRRRKNSGSEGSSGEELSHTDSHSLSDEKEDDDSTEGKFEQIMEDEEGEKGEKKSEGKVDLEMRKGSSGAGGEGSVLAEKDNQDFRTNTGMKQIVDVVSAKMAAVDLPQAADSDDDDDDDDDDAEEQKLSMDERTNAKLDVPEIGVSENVMEKCSDEIKCKASSSEKQGDSIVPDNSITEKGGVEEVVQSQDPEDKVLSCPPQKVDPVDNEAPASSNKGGNSSSTDANDVESVLSWKENDSAFGADDHKTKCAFTFSNSVIYDLDVD